MFSGVEPEENLYQLVNVGRRVAGPGQVEGAIEVLECKAVFVEHDPDSLVRGLGVFSRFLSADGFLHQAISVHASANPIALTA